MLLLPLHVRVRVRLTFSVFVRECKSDSERVCDSRSSQLQCMICMELVCM